MRLSAWARQGVHYNTALRWVRDNKMPVPFARTASGTILVKEFVEESGNTLDRVALYARVWTKVRPGGSALPSFSVCCKQQLEEIGSGLDGHRPKLMKLLVDPWTLLIHGRRSGKNQAQKAVKAIQG